METNLSIISLDRVGISIGLALKQKGKFGSITGWDRDPLKIKTVRGMNAFSALPSKLGDAVKGADLLIIAQSLNEVKETFAKIKKMIKKDAVILYFSCLPAAAAAWAEQELPDSVSFIALTHSINPKYLHNLQDSDPHADLFEDSRMFISHPTDLSSAVIKIATEVVNLLGAGPFFADMAEVNGLQTITHALPHIAAAALMDEIIHEPGWRDASQLAGLELAGMLRLLDSSSPEHLAEMLNANRENTLRVMANLQRSLGDLASLVEAGDRQKLEEKILHLQDEYSDWLRKRGNVQRKKGS